MRSSAAVGQTPVDILGAFWVVAGCSDGIPFKDIDLDSFTMEAFLRLSQMSKPAYEKVKKQTVEMLERGAKG